MVRYVRVLGCAMDAKRTLARFEAAMVGSGITVVPWPGPHGPNQLPDWYAVHFERPRGAYETLRAEVLRHIDATGLADDPKPEHVYA
jgi:hypothetical protein